MAFTLALTCCVDPEKSGGAKHQHVEEMLLEIAGDSSFLENQYLSRSRSDHFLRQLKRSPSAALYLKTSFELLNSGRSKEAIQMLETLAEKLNNGVFAADAEFLHTMNTQLSITQLRKGEQDNCIKLHNGESCILPLEGDGIYSITESTAAALNSYLKILKEYPEDLKSIWLLNIAYMAMGWYPDSVPLVHLISPSAFASGYDIGRFENIGSGMPVATRGLAGGCCVEDFDNDGFMDIVVSSMDVNDPLRYYRNTGDGSFEDISQKAGLENQLGGLNILHADFDNNGYADILVLRGGWFKNGTGEHPNSLLRNNGDGTFTDVTVEAGLLSFNPTQTAVWADFNQDGWLDLFVGNETKPGDTVSYPCELYINQKDGTFIDKAGEAGVDHVGFVKGVSTGDVNNDGHPDLYLSVFGEANLLYQNDGEFFKGGCTFTNVTAFARVAQPLLSFPTWFWDYNNDGWEDIFVGTYDYKGAPDDIVREYLKLPVKKSAYSFLYKNNGDGTFTNVALEVGLDKVLYSMGCNFGDLDNDGYLDFYVGTGAPDLKYIFPNRMFRNDGGQRFQDVTTSGGFGHLQKGHGIAFCDLDNDGDQDVYEVLGGAYSGDVFQNALFENPGHGNNWLNLKLEGVRSNKSAIGARIKLIVEGGDGLREIHRTVSTGGSFGGTGLQVEVGLGKAEEVIRLEITWPTSGTIQSFKNVGANQFLLIVEDTDQMLQLDREAISFRKNP
ncbi:MAG: CRTAC1 family protein [Flavobacteriales bacterium]|nr:CRTAC1 family protein [Flavobacteriales bacterium]